jgi:hypothetical protein
LVQIGGNNPFPETVQVEICTQPGAESIKFMKKTVATALLVFAVTPLLACPVCNSETGQAVRAGIFDENFTTNLFLLIAPTAAVVGLLPLLWRILPEQRERSQG